MSTVSAPPVPTKETILTSWRGSASTTMRLRVTDSHLLIHVSFSSFVLITLQRLEQQKTIVEVLLAATLLCSKRPGGGLYEASPEDNYHYTIALGLLRMKAHITLWCIKIGALDGILSYLMYLILFIELILHLPRVKQMNSQPIHLTNELIFCIQITRGRVDFNGNFPVKSPYWHQDLNL